MFPLQGGREKVNHSLSFVLGSKHLLSPKKSQIPNMVRDISFKQNSASNKTDAGMNIPASGKL